MKGRFRLACRGALTLKQQASTLKQACALVVGVAIVVSSGFAAEVTRAPSEAVASCKEGERNFPFLKQWIEKLSNFSAPVETGTVAGSVLYALGATMVPKGGFEAWKIDSATLSLGQKHAGGRIVTTWLGAYDKRKDGDKNQKRLGLWNNFLTDEEKNLLAGCTRSNCKIKFTPLELKRVADTSDGARPEAFRNLVEARMEEFSRIGRLHSYESEPEFVGVSLPAKRAKASSELRSEVQEQLDWHNLPVTAAIAPVLGQKRFWTPGQRLEFGFEHLDAEPGKHKPVTAIFSRNCERRVPADKMGKSPSYLACTDLVVYNNHYFDFWGRIALFFPWCDGHLALFYESMDVDQVKDSPIRQMLFGAEMRRLLGELLETRLKRLHMLGG